MDSFFVAMREGRYPDLQDRSQRLYLASITTAAYGVQTQRFTLRAGEPAERTITLRPVCRMEGRLVANQLFWARGRRLVFTSEKPFGPGETSRPPWPTEGHAEVTTDAQGRFVVPRIAAGRINRIEMVVDDELPVRPELPRWVNLPAAETTALVIPMVPLVDIRGSIVAKDTGEPLAGIKLHVYYGRYRQGTDVVSDEAGRFSARVLPGKVRFQPMNLSGTEYLQLGSPKEHEVPVDADGFELPAMELVPARPLDGRLVDQHDAPVAEASVNAFYGGWLCSGAKTDKDGRFRLPKMPVSLAVDEASYHVRWGAQETRRMDDGEVEIVHDSPFVLRLKR